MTPEQEAGLRRAAMHDGYELGYRHAHDDLASQPRGTCTCPLHDARTYSDDPDSPALLFGRDPDCLTHAQPRP